MVGCLEIVAGLLLLVVIFSIFIGDGLEIIVAMAVLVVAVEVGGILLSQVAEEG